MAERAPLAGWAWAPWCRQHFVKEGELELWANESGHWSIEIVSDRSGTADDPIAARIAAEDAARAMVAEMAAALGGRVMWGVPCPGCGTTEPDIVVDGETQCGRCGMIGSPVESEEDHG